MITHLLIFSVTGLSINGTYQILLANREKPDPEETFENPYNLISLTNSSIKYKKTNYRIHYVDKSFVYKNKLTVFKTVQRNLNT